MADEMHPDRSPDPEHSARQSPGPESGQKADHERLLSLQAMQEENDAIAALRSTELLGAQLLEANRKLELAAAEVARLHRALTERHSAAVAAEDREAALAARIADYEEAARAAELQRGEAAASQADVARVIESLRTELAETQAMVASKASTPKPPSAFRLSRLLGQSERT